MNGLLAFAKRPSFYPNSKTMRQIEKTIRLDRPNVVGVIHTISGFKGAGIAGLDAVEVRVDTLRGDPSLGQVADLPVAAIVTVRHRDEGGAKAMSEEERLAKYLALLPSASAIDLEIGSSESMRNLIQTVRRERKVLILSFHAFASTPPLAQLRTVCEKARGLGADIVKVAAKTETPGEVARLLALLEDASGPLAVMGMGALGRASRLLFAKAGSVLNYGWLGKPQVPGQWSAKELVDLLVRA
jgi:3-dehydroquinate dehydratase I